jgi:hypothetical protein
MDRFLNRQNIERYRRLRETPSADERLQIMKLLAEEGAKFKLEISERRSCKSIVENGVRQAKAGCRGLDGGTPANSLNIGDNFTEHHLDG